MVLKGEGKYFIYFDSALSLEELKEKRPFPLEIVPIKRKSTREIENEVLLSEFNPERILDKGFFGRYLILAILTISFKAEAWTYKERVKNFKEIEWGLFPKKVLGIF